MLTASAIGMVLYGAHEIVTGVIELAAHSRLELWAAAGLMTFGSVLILGAAFVRVRLPGGFELALGALLALQALALHNAAHFASVPTVFPQILRATLAVTLAGMAWTGGRASG